MGDYGHDLSFGAFLTPTNHDAMRTVTLAVLAEEAGLDLVTFQDHPYQSGYLDTWTLLSFVAARTHRVHLSANVTNLPLRPPAVLGRSVASLDLLSGGRVELGLGAGAFWEGVEAMGGRRLTGAESVRALEEAIDVIRQIWDGDVRGGVRVDGEFYRVMGAKRGPTPAHPVGIWLGAYKAKMLALTGRRADGWLPSLSYLQPGDLAAGNTVIDDAAMQAGRSPRDVRRLINISGEFTPDGRGLLHGPPRQWAEELAELTLRDGISSFILGSDNPDDLRRFAAEVAPAVRELVTAARAEPAPSRADSTPTASSFSSPSPSVGRRAVIATPDDGLRRSSQRPWDESTRPLPPDPDPAAAYTEHGLADAQHLVDIHDRFRADLTQIRDLIDQVAAGALEVGAARSQVNAMTLRQNKWTLGTYCESYCRVVTIHHSVEDGSTFPHLRRLDPRLTAVIGRLEEEHVTIHDVLDGIDRALVAFVSRPDGLPELHAAVDLLSDALLSHLAYEERALLEPISRLGLG